MNARDIMAKRQQLTQDHASEGYVAESAPQAHDDMSIQVLDKISMGTLHD